MKLKHFMIDQKNIHEWHGELSSLEGNFTYPFGDDSFKIDHGKNYLAFFERIGEVKYVAIRDGKRLVAVAAAILHKSYKSWYLCDLKVHPEYRGLGLTKKMFLRYFFPFYFKCRRGFGMTMMNEEGPQNKVINIMKNLPFTPLKFGTILNFYLEDYEKAGKYLELISGDYSFVAYNNVKALVMQKTQTPLPLLHLERGVQIQNQGRQKESLHMWSLPEAHPMNAQLMALNMTPSARGFIYHHGMKNADWSLLQTSEL